MLVLLCLSSKITTARRYRSSPVSDIYERTINAETEQIETGEHDTTREKQRKQSVKQSDQIATWLPWSRETSCSVSCGSKGYKQLLRDCSTGINEDCEAYGGQHWTVQLCYPVLCEPDKNITASGTRARKFLDQPDSAQPSWLPWTRTTACSVSCGGRGFQERERACSTGRDQDCQVQGGRHWEVVICQSGDCSPVWLEWGPLSACSVTCGYGVQARLRNCSTGASADCSEGKNYDLKVCSPGSCGTTTTTVKPAEWSEWTQYIQCSTTCGPGYAESIRRCSTGDSTDCSGKPWKVSTCSVADCKNDGEWSDWQAWAACSTTCGSGNQTRSRTCDYPDPTSPGVPCLGYSNETESCNLGVCPVDGVWSSWSSYEACSKTCGDGIKIRTRNCTFPADKPKGKQCDGLSMETTICHDADCPVDGLWTPWSAWAPCTQSCHGGIRFKARVCVFDESKPHGKDCQGQNIVTEVCNTGECVVDGEWGNWLSWSQCSHSCGGGLQSHTRTCVYRGSAAHGKDCSGNNTEIQNCGQRECPVNGVWSSWGPWAQCSLTCGGGQSTRNRNCTYSSSTAPRGKTCEGNGYEQKDCNTKLCPVDAQWSVWSRYSSCSVTCGNGERVRTRNCTYDPVAPLGRDCFGSPEERQPCTKSKCPVDGTLSSWGSWTPCTASCSGGLQSRTRQCHFPKKVPHGKDCVEKLSEKTTCNELPCPTTTTTTTTTTLPTAPGHWSDWSSWSLCTQTCGSGVQDRMRNCTYPDKTLHGEKCPGSSNQTQQCNTGLCPVDGVWSDWSGWSRCSVTCSNGTQTRNRSCDYDPIAPKGDPCTGEMNETTVCSPQLCPVDGLWSSWLEWTTCDVTCGGGQQTRQRKCEYKDGFPHGQICTGDHADTQNCSTNLCPVDGVLSEWSEWTECTVTCGGGTHMRNRTCDFPDGVTHGSDCLGVLNQTQGCNNPLCPVDGRWSDWEEWSACTVTCGGGSETRHRTCIYDSHAPHGNNCTGQTSESQKCNLDTCPVDGHFSEWSNWDSCSTTCGNGTHNRARQCVFVLNAPRGNNCTGTTMEIEECDERKCPVDGVLSSWSTWTACTVTCGNGTSQRNRSCDFPADAPPGANCTGDLKETIDCGTDLCPIDGVLTAWSNWTSCTMSCGGGTQQRTRDCEFDDVAPPGNNCTGDLSETQPCGDSPCPVDGVWSEWGDFSNCTKTCGNGTQFRTRICQFKDGFPRGENCTGSRSDAKECNTNLCPVDGQFSAWSDWTECTKSCNNGTKTRNRTCDFLDNVPHGIECQGDFNETVTCHEDPCPIDGHWSDWSNFTVCTVSCGGGVQSRNRTCIFVENVQHGAKCFGNVTEVQDCQTKPCPVDGVWGAWQSWSTCPVTCGGGKAARIRDCTFKDGIPHGLDCVGDKNEIKDCATNLCAVDGRLTEWIGWTACSGTCGPGTHFRTRKCEFDPVAPAGKNCTETLQEQEACTNPNECPVDGFWQKWSRWGHCTKTCDEGTQTRRRTCYFPPGRPTGEYCQGPGTSKRKCNTDPCKVDGQWTTWGNYSGCTATCGGGTQTRSRNCTFPDGAAHGNPCVGQPDESIKCNQNECPQDAQWSVWSDWSNCTATCGGGTKFRNRTCDWPTSVHGSNCTGDFNESTSCNDGLCPVDGKWNEWSDWGDCSATCNVGLKVRNRTCVYDIAAPKGVRCIGENIQRSVCADGLCPQNGSWTDWQAWSQCSVTCGNGTELRTRKCAYIIPGAPIDQDCQGPTNETRECSNTTDCPVDGYWDKWSVWSSCTAMCGDAIRYHNRTCLFDESKPHGFDCFGESNETEHCRLGQCPVDGSWDGWSVWTSCTETCGGGSKSRNRTCLFIPDTAPHGDNCTGNSTDVIDCNTTPCAVDGSWDRWSVWTSCTETCGGGSKSRNRTCLFIPDTAPHGDNCTGNSTDVIDCNTTPCAVDGSWDGWSVWTSCTETCGGGSKSRNRTCLFIPDTAPHGDNCTGNSTDVIDCNTTPCAVDGSWDGWSVWTSCTETCGGGSKSRNRTCLFIPDTAPHGDNCTGNSTDVIDCNTTPCAVDGSWDGWSVWTSCTETCGGGLKSRNRTCLFIPDTAPHGDNCTGNSTDVIDCNTIPCTVDGTWTDWTAWSGCSVTCEDGIKTRTRDCYFPASAVHGLDCVGSNTENKTCSTNMTCPPTTTPAPHSCFLCLDEDGNDCDILADKTDCPAGLNYCINNITNLENSQKIIGRRCGTLADCYQGWYQKYSSEEECILFDSGQVYTSAFYCEYCCEGNNCNEEINMPNKYIP